MFSRRSGAALRGGEGLRAHQHHRADRAWDVQGDVGAEGNGVQNSDRVGPFGGPDDHGAAGLQAPGL